MITAAHRLFQVGGFSPLSLNPALWLSDTGSSAGQWDDLSGNGRHATQGTGANQPSIVTSALNGRQVRRFDGTNDFLSNTSGLGAMSGITVFAVAIQQVLTNDRTFIASEWNTGASAGTNEWVLSLYGTDGTTQGIPSMAVEIGTNYRPVIDPTTRINQWFVMAGQHNGSLVSVTVNGGTTFTATASGTMNTVASRQFYVGTLHANGSPAALSYKGDIAEIIVYPSSLNTSQRQQVENYLKQKYAL